MKISDLPLNHHLLRVLEEKGFTEPTPIQQKSIPLILEGRDVFGQSSTGSGKTAAFGLPILEQLMAEDAIARIVGIRVLVLTPTRELCVQVTDALKDFSKYTHFMTTSVFGGVGIEPQIADLRRANIVVGTPGRILDHITRNTIDLRRVQYLVLDEADKMFEMGFIDDVERIIQYIPKHRQTLLFSATIPSRIRDLVKNHMKNPLSLTSSVYVDKSLLKQVYYVISFHDKFSLLVHLLRNATPGLALVFCATRDEASRVAKNLKIQGVKAMAIHGGLAQNKRLNALDALRNEDIAVLVATDVAARGLDIKNVTHVYNYDVPKSSDEYIHRIGRTARAGSEGDAVTLLCEKDYDNFNRVLSDSLLEIKRTSLPAFMKVRFHREELRSRYGSHSLHSSRLPGSRSFGERISFGAHGMRRSSSGISNRPQVHRAAGSRGSRPLVHSNSYSHSHSRPGHGAAKAGSNRNNRGYSQKRAQHKQHGQYRQ